MGLVPRDGGFDDLAECLAGIDLVMAPALQHDQLLRLARLGIEGFAFVRRHQPVLVTGDEQHRAGGDPVDDPFGVKTQRVVDELQRDFADRAGVAAPGGGGQFG